LANDSHAAGVEVRNLRVYNGNERKTLRTYELADGLLEEASCQMDLIKQMIANPGYFPMMLLCCIALGCGGRATEGVSSSNGDAPTKDHSQTIKTQEFVASNPSETTNTPETNPAPSQPKRESESAPLLGDLLDGKPFEIAKMPVDDERATANGIRRVAGKHLIVYTDMPADKEIDGLPAVFDLAVPQWCDYFAVDPTTAAEWQMTGFLMKDREKFDAAGLFPAELPQFLHGYNRGFELWLYEQPTTYYRRHLLLHEGTHGFMTTMLGAIGPPWYGEGLAELLATHRWSEDNLTLRYNPRSKEEVPGWGRIKIIKDRLELKEALRLEDVLRLGPTAHKQTEPYAWCWAAASFFDHSSQYQSAFRGLKDRVTNPTDQFNTAFLNQLRDDWPQISEQWQLNVQEMDYGFDFARAAIQYKPGEPLSTSGTTVTIAADRGWQSSSVRLEAGTTYSITAEGRYQVADEPKIWWCEPGGVTIRYHNGKPLGVLMGAMRDDENPLREDVNLAISGPLGLSRELTPRHSGTLYLRINESPADLADNAGQLKVKIVAK